MRWFRRKPKEWNPNEVTYRIEPLIMRDPVIWDAESFTTIKENLMPDYDDVLDDYEDRCEEKTDTRQPDPEVEALRSISAALEPLDRAARERVVGWAIARFDIHGINGFEIVSATAMVATPEAAAAIAKRGNTTYRCQVQQAGSGTCTWPTCGCGDA